MKGQESGDGPMTERGALVQGITRTESHKSDKEIASGLFGRPSTAGAAGRKPTDELNKEYSLGKLCKDISTGTIKGSGVELSQKKRPATAGFSRVDPTTNDRTLYEVSNFKESHKNYEKEPGRKQPLIKPGYPGMQPSVGSGNSTAPKKSPPNSRPASAKPMLPKSMSVPQESPTTVGTTLPRA